MADYNSALPIRTENAGDVQMKLVDGTNTAQVLKIEADGSINANISTGDLDVRDLAFATDKVDVSGSTVDVGNFPSSFEVSNFPSLADLDIRDLDKDSDSVTAHLASGSQIEISNASLAVTASDLDIRDLVYTSDSVTAHLASGSQIEISNASLAVTASDLDIRDLDKDADSVTAYLAGGSSIEVSNFPASFEVSNFGDIADLDIRDLAYATDSVTAHLAEGSSVLVDSMWEATYHYEKEDSIAAAGSSQHEMTSPSGKDVKLLGVRASASGKAKLMLEREVSVGVWEILAVAFNSASNPNIELDLCGLKYGPSSKFRITMYNRDSAAMDMHSTFIYETK